MPSASHKDDRFLWPLFWYACGAFAIAYGMALGQLTWSNVPQTRLSSHPSGLLILCVMFAGMSTAMLAFWCEVRGLMDAMPPAPPFAIPLLAGVLCGALQQVTFVLTDLIPARSVERLGEAMVGAFCMAILALPSLVSAEVLGQVWRRFGCKAGGQSRSDDQ